MRGKSLSLSLSLSKERGQAILFPHVLALSAPYAYNYSSGEVMGDKRQGMANSLWLILEDEK